MAAANNPRRIWVDLTNSPHVLVMRPVIAELQRRGYDVVVTAREYAQTLPLLERFSIPHVVIGRHRGRNMAAKAFGLVARSAAMIAFGAGKGFSLGISHASNDLPVACAALRIPHVTMFDYEFARLSHSINVRLSRRVVVPDAIPLEALRQYGADERKVVTYPGLKEEYYLSDFEPDQSVLDELGLDRDKVLVLLRTPPSMAAYHRMDNPLFREILAGLASRDDVQAVLLLRTQDQISLLDGISARNIVVPERVVDAQSLAYFADAVISGGGTLNREAAALGTPAYTVFQGVLGAVDRMLAEQGRLIVVRSLDDVRLAKKDITGAERVRRDVSSLVDRILGEHHGA
ncbi:MAG: DUF354 domain-containing protein [Coriobacteriia bacterium]|nr:DUF354 domain-containing protein [Coriobacteriia bacterium]